MKKMISTENQPMPQLISQDIGNQNKALVINDRLSIDKILISRGHTERFS